MSIRASITGRVTDTVVRVNNVGGSIAPASSGVTLKNKVQEFRTLEDFGNVVTTQLVNGATLVYNSELDKYEIKPIDLGATGLDGGSF
jgi:hypothetical protein